MSGLRERLAEATLNAQCASCGHEAGEHSWLGPCIVDLGNYDDACPCQHSREQIVAQALLPVVEREIAATRGEAWEEGHAAGRDYQGDGWNSDVHDPARDNPYRAALSPDPDRGEGGDQA